jgi:uncharacterized protein (TIGR02145 family)
MMDLTSLSTFKRNNKIKIEKLLNNIAPVFTSSATATVVENQTTAITLVATDEQAITYSISGGDSALFSVVGSTGVVSFATAPDFESPNDSDTNNTYAFSATATDAKGLPTTQSVVVTVINTDDTAPAFTSSASANAAENQTAAITLVATDATTVTYSISGTDASLFNTNSGSGVVTFKTAPDYETPGDSGTDNVYNFTATATDTASNATTQAVVITVTDVSEIVTMTDGSGNSYSAITFAAATINSVAYPAQTWTATNLKTLKYINGTDVTGVTSYSYNTANDANGYGKLYTWNAATNTTAATSETDNVLGICGTGWHIPTDKDWKNLEGLLGMTTAQQDGTGYRGTDEGSKLIVGGSSGFEVIYAGSQDGSFWHRGSGTYLWSSTELNSSNSYNRALYNHEQRVYRSTLSKAYGYGIRCLKD